MTIFHQDFDVLIGTDKTITVTLYDSANAVYGTTSGLVFTWGVYPNVTAQSALFNKISETGITNGTGQITIVIADTNTSAMTAGGYYHECRVVDANASADVVFNGAFRLLNSPSNYG